MDNKTLLKLNGVIGHSPFTGQVAFDNDEPEGIRIDDMEFWRWETYGNVVFSESEQGEYRFAAVEKSLGGACIQNNDDDLYLGGEYWDTYAIGIDQYLMVSDRDGYIHLDIFRDREFHRTLKVIGPNVERTDISIGVRYNPDNLVGTIVVAWPEGIEMYNADGDMLSDGKDAEIVGGDASKVMVGDKIYLHANNNVLVIEPTVGGLLPDRMVPSIVEMVGVYRYGIGFYYIDEVGSLFQYDYDQNICRKLGCRDSYGEIKSIEQVSHDDIVIRNHADELFIVKIS